MDYKEERLMNLETTVADLEKTVDDLNQVVISHWKIIEKLQGENKYLIEHIKSMNSDFIKSQDEETLPPHY